MINYLEWDSSFFSRRIGVLANYGSTTLSEEFFLEAQMYDLVYITSLKAIESNEVELVDIKNTFRKSTVEGLLYDCSNRPRNYDSDRDRFEELLKLVYLSGHESRFKKEPYFNENDFKRLYLRWIERSLANENEIVLVKSINESIAGFVSCKLNSQDHVTIELIAVDPKFHGKGIGKDLITSVETELGAGKLLRVATQDWNTGACLFYKKSGFQLETKSFIYHYAPNSL